MEDEPARFVAVDALEPATALPDGSSAFAEVTLDFSVDGPTPFLKEVRADAGRSRLVSVAATMVVEPLVLTNANLRSVDRPLLNEYTFASVRAEATGCGNECELQPAKTAASAPARSVLMQIPLEELIPQEFLAA